MEGDELLLKKQRESSAKIQSRLPQNGQRLVPLTSRVILAMQNVNRMKPPIADELESIQNFSIVKAVRSEVNKIINKLPIASTDVVWQDKIDALIRRNLLKERKVRFNEVVKDETEENPLEHDCDIQNTAAIEEDDNALAEVDAILRILGNDQNNRLIIENFYLLEQRISCVEQRLSGLIRRIPELNQTCRSDIKIDIDRVKEDVEHFVETFNNVFKSSNGFLQKNSIAKTISSTERLKFHLLSQLSKQKLLAQTSSELAGPEWLGGVRVSEADDFNMKKLNEDAGVKRRLMKKLSRTDLHAIKPRDSLIKLRQRFRSQSKKYRHIKSKNISNENSKKTNPEQIAEKRIKEIFFAKTKDRDSSVMSFNDTIKPLNDGIFRKNPYESDIRQRGGRSKNSKTFNFTNTSPKDLKETKLLTKPMQPKRPSRKLEKTNRTFLVEKNFSLEKRRSIPKVNSVATGLTADALLNYKVNAKSNNKKMEPGKQLIKSKKWHPIRLHKKSTTKFKPANVLVRPAMISKSAIKLNFDEQQKKQAEKSTCLDYENQSDVSLKQWQHSSSKVALKGYADTNPKTQTCTNCALKKSPRKICFEKNPKLKKSKEKIDLAISSDPKSLKNYKKVFFISLSKPNTILPQNKVEPEVVVQKVPPLKSRLSMYDAVPKKINSKSSKVKSNGSKMQETKTTESRLNQSMSRRKFHSTWIYPKDGDFAASSNNDPWSTPEPQLNTSNHRKSKLKIQK